MTSMSLLPKAISYQKLDVTELDWSYDSTRKQAFSSLCAARAGGLPLLESSYPVDVNCTFHCSTFLSNTAQLRPSYNL